MEREQEMIIRLPIDIKSLYMNIKNDNKSGHTATVATPLKQGASIHEELSKILEIPEIITQSTREELVGTILSKSRAEAIIPHIYVFNKLYVNGEAIEDTPSFCMYIREETAPTNVHCGRQKVHYPLSLNYVDAEIEIDNKKVMNAVSQKLQNYAFIIEAFEYDTEENSLNFDALVIGENGIPYSKVFLNKKGVGNKFTSAFTENFENYDMEIISLRNHFGYDNVGPDNFTIVQERNRQDAISRVVEYLNRLGKIELRCLVEDYPYALYDIEIRNGQKKEYIMVRNTSTKLTYFTLPYGKIKFSMDYKDKVKVILVKDINGEPVIECFTSDEINMLNKSINSVVYEKRG